MPCLGVILVHINYLALCKHNSVLGLQISDHSVSCMTHVSIFRDFPSDSTNNIIITVSVLVLTNFKTGLMFLLGHTSD